MAARGKTQKANRRAAQCSRRDARVMQIINSLAAQKLAADFVMCAALFFKQCDSASSLRKAKRCHGPRRTAPNDEMVHHSGRFSDCLSRAHSGLLRATHNLAGL